MYLSSEQMNSHPGRVTAPCRAMETLLEKGSGPVNEDRVLVEPEQALYGVFDGATSLASGNDHLRGGLLAATIAAESFRTGPGSLRSRASLANRQIAASYREAGGCTTRRHLFWSTCMAVVKIHEKSLRYCKLGDSQILLILKDGSSQLLTKEYDIDRETLVMWKEKGQDSSLSIHELLREQIRDVRLGMNRDYGVLNGEPEAMNFLESGECALAGVSAVLIFTDGLFPPKEDPAAQTDWDVISDRYISGGLQAVYDHIRQIERQDPLCRALPRFKCHDDIGAVALRFS